MKKKIYFISGFISLSVLSFILYSVNQISPACLKHKNQQYSALYEADLYTFSGIGIMGTVPEHLNAFHCLLEDEDSVPVLKNLRQSDSKVTQLYAMIALKKFAPEIYSQYKAAYLHDESPVDKVEGSVITESSVAEEFTWIEYAKD